MQRYFYRHTYNKDNIPNCRYAIPTWKVSFQEILTVVCVTILLCLVQNTCSYLHGRYIFKKYLLLYVSLSCCIFEGNTFTYCTCFCAGFRASFCAGFRAGFCAGFCASPSARSRRSRIAATSPTHRRHIAGSHRRRIASRASCRLP
jgi:hypothetical protein